METTKRFTTYQLVVTALMAAVMCVVGPFSIPLPITLVPITLTNLIIYLSAYLLPWQYCTISYIVYLLLGFVGLPVFSGFTGGAYKLAGPTGGYLIGFIFTAMICSFFIHKFERNIIIHIFAMIAGLAVAYLFGTIWFSIQQHMGIIASLSACVFPFLIGDAIKIAVAALAGSTVRLRLQKANLI